MMEGDAGGEDGAFEVDVEGGEVGLGGVEVGGERSRSGKVAELADAGIGDDDVECVVGGEGEGAAEEGEL